MAKIAIDARRLRDSTGRYVRELIKQLEVIDSENEYHVIIHTDDQTHWSPTAQNFYLHVVPFDHYTFGEQLGFARFLRKLHPDLVHFAMPQQPLLYFGKRVTTVHDLTLVRFKNLDKNPIIYAIEQAIFKFLLKNVARRSRQVITPTKFVKNDIASYARIPLDKITVTYEAAVEMQKTLQQPVSTLKNKDFIFYVGNAFPHKNLDTLVEAFIELKQKHPRLHLAFAGKKEFFYEKLESKYESQKDLHILGFVTDEQLAWLFKHAQAYVFPSLSEGFGLPGLEVMQHGTPLVSSSATCLPEVYGEGAYYFNPESSKDMARAIHEVLKSETRRKKLTKAGHVQLERYSWQKTAKQTLKVYKKALETS